ncbi:MFS transporter, partial [Pseudomonas aeruginosa]|nr:MFS transporter [Pseudomonas aeruginosa]
MNEQDYLIAWGAYAIAGLGLMLVFWLMTGWMWRLLREPLRLIVFILLFTPTPVDPQNDLYAPAIAITALDVVFNVGNNAWRAVSDLALV